MPILKKTIKKVLAERGYKHAWRDDEFSLHGDYARNMQYAFSKQHTVGNETVTDIIFLSADLHDEKIVIGFYRENMTITNGVIENTNVAIPLAKYSIEEVEKQVDRLIPKRLPVQTKSATRHSF